jgi:hypothetical protein
LSEDWKAFRHHLEETRGWFRATGVPALIGRCETLAALEPKDSVPPNIDKRPSMPAPTRVETGRKRDDGSKSQSVVKDLGEPSTDSSIKTLQR